MALTGFGQAYLENLRDLTSPDRRSIVTLKDLAFENLSEAASVVKAIRHHVKHCPTAHRLAALYLVDCMLKSDPCPAVYMEQFTQVLLEIFVFLWDNADAPLRVALTKVCKLWRPIAQLDQKVVQACESYMMPAGQQASSSGMPAMGGVLPPAYRGYPVIQLAPALPIAPFGPLIGSRPSWDPRLPGPQPHAPQPAAAPYPAAPRPSSYHHQHAPPAMLRPMHAPPYQPMQQQPQQQVMLQRESSAVPYAWPPFHTVPMMHPAAQPGQSGARAGPAHSAQHSASPSSPPPRPSSPNQQQPASRQRSTEFLGPQALKEIDPGAVRDLAEASARTRPAFLDSAFLRNKRRAAQAAAGAALRQWFPTADMWLVGTTSLPDSGVEAVAEEETGKAESTQLYYVEEDPSQPECAISGEAFERFYDPDTDKWCYKDAVLLSGEDADKYGVMEGSIVKVQCLAGAPSKLQMATLRAATATDAAAEDLRRAAAVQPGEAAGGGGGGSSGGGSSWGGSGGDAAGPALSPHPAAEPAAPSGAPAAAASAVAAGWPPHVAVKEEQHAEVPLGAVGGASGSKRPADTAGGVAPGAAAGAAAGARLAGGAASWQEGAFPEAKRLKLEVQ
ncbi:hypothetical protein TSOC_012797 [Tetrabaena socialis]|uniref:CID domain-containing protein n=1 Tax=Tetrabaena socialis TaxID=47790 RepID=A0A2J7ZM33_9CHLO|nr:hypothetical protein TSOC_012797 [Tetrabaena socialis]|eukprot:PNH01325.1 hypothetical protein TSOC_012797 [Tetrabaena socialis]